MGLEENIKKAGRPFKMNENWLSTLFKVLNDENILFLSDKDLLFLVNREILNDNEKITKRTFENWKAGKFHPDDEIGKEFIKAIEYALIKQKQFLSEKMINDDKNWQRYAWIMERKFSEWNLKHISENIHRNEQETIIQISAGNDQQKALIDNIINADFIEISPKRISIDDNINESDYDF